MYPTDLTTLIEKNSDFIGLFLERIRQLSLNDFVFDFNKGKSLFVSLNSMAPFIVFNADLNTFPPGGELHSFAIDLRRFLRGRLTKIYQPNNDMILALEFTGRNSIFETEILTLYLELIPRHPQAVLINEKAEVIAAFRYNNERGKDGRLIRRNVTYELPQAPQKLEDKCNRDYDYLTPYLADFSERIKKQNFRDIYVYLEHNLKRLKRLKQNFESDLLKLENLPVLYEEATALLTEKPAIHADFVEIYGKNIKVDPRYNAIGNAEILFKRAKKIKKSEAILQQKIVETTARILYLEGILRQVGSNDNEAEIYEIYTELNILKPQVKKKVVSKLNPYFLTYQNTLIMFGRNNHQNDHLSFKIAKNNMTFLHIRNHPGAHIIIDSQDPSKSVLEFAGNLALFLSKKEDGEVTYTSVNKIKKGAYPGQVIMREEKTFFLRFNDELRPIFQNEIKRYL